MILSANEGALFIVEKIGVPLIVVTAVILTGLIILKHIKNKMKQ